MVSVLGLISLTIKAHCGLQQKEARAECAAVAGVGAAPGRSCVFWPEPSSTLPRDGNWSHSCGSSHGYVGCCVVSHPTRSVLVKLQRF